MQRRSEYLPAQQDEQEKIQKVTDIDAVFADFLNEETEREPQQHENPEDETERHFFPPYPISASISIGLTLRSRARKPISIASATAPSIRKRTFDLSSLRNPDGSMTATALATFQFKTGLFGWTSLPSSSAFISASTAGPMSRKPWPHGMIRRPSPFGLRGWVGSSLLRSGSSYAWSPIRSNSRSRFCMRQRS